MPCKVTGKAKNVDCSSGDGDGDLGGTGRGTVLSLSEEEDCAEETCGEGFDVGVEGVGCFGGEDGGAVSWVERFRTDGSWLDESVLIPFISQKYGRRVTI